MTSNFKVISAAKTTAHLDDVSFRPTFSRGAPLPFDDLNFDVHFSRENGANLDDLFFEPEFSRENGANLDDPCDRTCANWCLNGSQDSGQFGGGLKLDPL